MDRGASVATGRRTLRLVVGGCIAVGCLIWVIRDVDPMQVASHLSQLRMRWIAAAIICDIASYVCDGSRWKLLLSPVGRLSLLRATQAVYAGLFLNEMLPLRAGEFYRAHLASQWISVPLSDVIPSLVIARIIDAMWLAVAIGCTALVAPLPGNLASAAKILATVVLASVVGLVLLSMRRQDEVSTVMTSQRDTLLSRIRAATVGIRTGLGNIARAPVVWRAAASSIGIPISQALAFWLVMRAYGLEQPFAIGAVVFLIVQVGTAVPNAPANVGSYQVLTVLGLTLVGVNKSEAAGFSIIVFLVLTLPLWVLGLTALRFSGISGDGIRPPLRTSQQPS
jgi:glycosyltransferase 2 family protein